MIQTLKQIFPFPAVLPDHTPGWDIDIAAVVLGADLLEKTITSDHCTRSIKHIFSLEGAEPAAFIRATRDLETALGEPRRHFSPEERRKHLATRRSTFLAHPKKKEERIEAGDIDFCRPGARHPLAVPIGLACSATVRPLALRDDVRNAWYLYMVRGNAAVCDEVFATRRQRNIGVDVQYMPVYLFRATAKGSASLRGRARWRQPPMPRC